MDYDERIPSPECPYHKMHMSFGRICKWPRLEDIYTYDTYDDDDGGYYFKMITATAIQFY